MRVPPEVRDRLHINGEAYLKLKKALYGLKQASRNWYQTLCKYLLDSGYVLRSKLDHCLFFQHTTNKELWIVIHVDDMAIAASTVAQINDLVTLLEQKFTVTCKPLTRYLGLEVEYDRDKQQLSFHLHSYINFQVKRFEKLFNVDLHHTNNPMQPVVKLHMRTIDEPAANDHNYRSIIGAIMFIAQACYPIIMYQVNKCSQYMSNPSLLHQQAALDILAYLKYHANHCILYTATNTPSCFESTLPPPTMLHSYVDSDHGACVDTRRSTTGYLQYYGNCLISWCTRLQPSASGHGPQESEYKAFYLAASELIHTKQLCNEVGLIQAEANTIYEDNAGVISFIHGNTSASRMKSVDIQCHAVKEWAAQELIQPTKIQTHFNKADIMTKPMQTGQYTRLAESIMNKL